MLCGLKIHVLTAISLFSGANGLSLCIIDQQRWTSYSIIININFVKIMLHGLCYPINGECNMTRPLLLL